MRKFRKKTRGTSSRGNVICLYQGEKFHSKAEMARYKDLLLLKSAGEISDIDRQVPLLLTVNKIKICNYIADFVYRDNKEFIYVIEDVKGYHEPVFKLKWKLAQALYPAFKFKLYQV
jgi:hypothetical protein